MSRWFTKHQKRAFFAVTLIRKPKPAVTGQNSIFWGFSGYTGDIFQGCFLLRNGIYGQKNTGNDDELPGCPFLDLFRKSCLFYITRGAYRFLGHECISALFVISRNCLAVGGFSPVTYIKREGAGFPQP
ncbi:hypothetical protein [Morganella morganii]|uniref:hypothetical protein n=1 Tax=Morganella morganii TaxID=582 RepID=UPI001F086CDB|nr:hypothetical protein [Morganella morganii]